MSPPETTTPATADLDRLLDGLQEEDGIGFWTPQGQIRWRDWVAEVARRRRSYLGWNGRRVGLIFRPSPTSYATLIGLSTAGADVALIDPQLGPDATAELCRAQGIAALVDPAEDDPRVVGPADSDATPTPGGVTLFTSGSTGAPKAVRHDWRTLCRPVRLGTSAEPQTWLLTYRPHLYAGIQVFVHVLLNRGTLVLPDPGASIAGTIQLMRDAGVRQVSATPSYWRRLITLGDTGALRAIDLAQITLGGEASDQPLLDALRRLFPAARIVQIYATSELGRCLSVKDGRAGIPLKALDGPTEDGVALRVVDGELEVRSANAMLGDGEAPDSGWMATGDLVEVSGDRCLFVGRRTELINVGGNKVHPLRVERVVQSVPGVTDARVFGKRSSLVGQLVACEVVIAPGLDGAAVTEAVLRECRDRLAPHERPRFVQVVEAIVLSEAGKKVRRQG